METLTCLHGQPMALHPCPLEPGDINWEDGGKFPRVGDPVGPGGAFWKLHVLLFPCGNAHGQTPVDAGAPWGPLSAAGQHPHHPWLSPRQQKQSPAQGMKMMVPEVRVKFILLHPRQASTFPREQDLAPQLRPKGNCSITRGEGK